MRGTRKLYAAKAALLLGTIPVLIWAYEYGPDAGHAGVPNELGTCLGSGCHVGTLNGSGGGVSIAFPNGNTYVPGVKQHLVVTISDSAATQQAWGFQLTARNSSSSSTTAGTFASTDATTLLMCAAAANLNNEQEVDYSSTKAQTCPANMALQYIEHSQAGYQSTLGKTGSASYEFDWTPPASAVGNIVFYVAGNAGLAGAVPVATSAHIYTATATVSPGTAGPSPSIASNGIVNGASFQPGIVPNSWFTIQGTNLSPVTDTWANSIVNGQLPTKLDGVSVSVGGKPAYIYYISSGQINALAPDVGTGSIQVTVTTPSGTSTAVATNSQTASPAFFLWANQYAVATRQDYSWAVKNGTFPGATTTPAKPGDVLILWGTGFGPTSPAAPVGVQVPATTTYLVNNVTVTIGNLPATVYGTALAPGFAGLYQVAIQVPSNAPDGDLPVVASVNGVSSPTGVTLTVQH